MSREQLLPCSEAPWYVAGLACRAQADSCDEDWLAALLASPSLEVRAELETRSFDFLEPLAVSVLRETVRSAGALINQIHSLGVAVRQHVEAVSLLAAKDGYDVSHSEPRWKNWIFVSCPTVGGEVSALRLAENVVHEAMHHQLSEVEDRSRLVKDEVEQLYSPWKQESRNLIGVLHGLYVFRCIDLFLGQLAGEDVLTERGRDYAARRKREVAAETDAVSLAALKDGLTAHGKDFLGYLYAIG